jgi:hypothetical protein
MTHRLQSVATTLVTDGKGILEADERGPRCALSTAAHVVASYAASNRKVANGSCPGQRRGFFALD